MHFVVEGKTMDELFHAHLPDNLYLNHYKLKEKYQAYTPEEWRIFLREKERFILNEVAAITEASAREALSKLSEGELTAPQIQGIRQLLDRSEQINQSNQEQRTFVTTYINPTPLEEPKSSDQLTGEHIQQNIDNYKKVYQDSPYFKERQEEGEIYTNRDGTLHFPYEHKMTELDHLYLRLFNPTNRRSDDLPDFESQMGDAQ